MKRFAIYGSVLMTLGIGLAACASLEKVREGEKREFTTAYRHEDRLVEKFNVDNVTSAPLRFVVMADVHVPTRKAFDLVSKDLPSWVAKVKKVKWDNSHSEIKGSYGAGSVRLCSFDGHKLVENITYWDEGRVYAYALDPERSDIPFPIKEHLGVMIVEDDGNGGSLITIREYYDKKFNLMAIIVTPYMRSMMVDSLENIVNKYGGQLVAPNL